MSESLTVRTAKKDYVCSCCKHIIHSGEEYIDRIIFKYGECVRHERCHDECPRDSAPERLFKKLFAHVEKYGEQLQMLDKDGVVRYISGLKYVDGVWYVNVVNTPWLALSNFIENYRDENGDTI